MAGDEDEIARRRVRGPARHRPAVEPERQRANAQSHHEVQRTPAPRVLVVGRRLTAPTSNSAQVSVVESRKTCAEHSPRRATRRCSAHGAVHARQTSGAIAKPARELGQSFAKGAGPARARNRPGDRNRRRRFAPSRPQPYRAVGGLPLSGGRRSRGGGISGRGPPKISSTARANSIIALIALRRVLLQRPLDDRRESWPGPCPGRAYRAGASSAPRPASRRRTAGGR